jgi:hypothetical protein
MEHFDSFPELGSQGRQQPETLAPQEVLGLRRQVLILIVEGQHLSKNLRQFWIRLCVTICL